MSPLVSAPRAHAVVAMLLGLLLVSLVGPIPVLGALVGLAAVVPGVGALTLSGSHAYRDSAATAPVVEPPTRLPTAA